VSVAEPILKLSSGVHRSNFLVVAIKLLGSYANTGKNVESLLQSILESLFLCGKFFLTLLLNLL
jgi:hypothetical protein